MAQMGTRGQNGRPETAAVLDPQAAKEARIKAIFRDQAKQLAGLFPKDGMTLVARACSAAIMASRAPALRGASPEGIAEKVIAAHHLGVEIGDAYLVPFKGDVQLILGPRALIALMYRSGFVKSVEARAVFEGDDFEYELGDEPRVRHVKGAERRAGAIVAGYAIVHTSTGGVVREVLTRDDIEYYRSFSQAKSGPWFDNFEGMVRKTLIHRIAEFIPRSPLLSAALTQNAEGGIEVSDEIMALIRAQNTAPAEPVIEQTPQGAEPASDTNGGAT
jgi:recombination protein RecT